MMVLSSPAVAGAGPEARPTASSLASHPIAAQGAPGPGTPTSHEGTLHLCLTTLQGRELASVQGTLVRDFRLSLHDAVDIARDAMLRVCVGHAERGYRNLGAAFLTAARNQARRDAVHRRRFPICPVDDQLPACSASADDRVRVEQESLLVEAALCKEDLVTQRIVRLRTTADASFQDLGRDHGLDADQARARYHNGLRRVQRRVAEACGGT
jgi:DNA-directed RNA polymerase specialized sigma24 family protein